MPEQKQSMTYVHIGFGSGSRMAKWHRQKIKSAVANVNSIMAKMNFFGCLPD